MASTSKSLRIGTLALTVLVGLHCNIAEAQSVKGSGRYDYGSWGAGRFTVNAFTHNDGQAAGSITYRGWYWSPPDHREALATANSMRWNP